MHRQPDWRGRRSIRLKGYDYASAGAYFITICTHERLCLLDSLDVRDVLSHTWTELPHGFPDVNIDEFVIMPNHIHGIILINMDGLSIHQGDLVGADLRVCPVFDPGITGKHTGSPIEQGDPVGADLRACPVFDTGITGEHMGSPIEQGDPVGADLRACPVFDTGITGEHTGSPLHRVVQWYKTMTTNYYIQGVKNRGWEPFQGKLWQRNYYEHIVRDDEELNTVRQYIRDNPLKWESDSENPLNLKTKR